MRRNYDLKDKSVSETAKDFYNELSVFSSNSYERKQSQIINLRGFNNYVKSIILSQTINHLKSKFQKVKVLDLCCGKGGDINKWLHGSVDSIIFTDIAEMAVEECRNRYYNNSNFMNPPAEFIVANASKDNIWDKVESSEKYVHLTSCMFALHYSFESIEQAYQFLQNACQNLVKGGKFVGIIPNAYTIYDILKENNGYYESKILQLSANPLKTDLFGSKYNFKLHNVVNCPEFLVYFPLLEKILSEMNMKCTFKMPLHHFVMKYRNLYRHLERKIYPFKVFENINSLENMNFTIDGLDYSHCLQYREINIESKKFYTISKEEWDVIGMYTIFEFEKIDDNPYCIWNSLIPIYKSDVTE